jgi:hypothetical protein
VRVVEFELEGSNASIQESLRSLGSALRNNREPVISLPAPQALPAALERSSPPNRDFSDSIDTLFVQQDAENDRPKPNSSSRVRTKTYRTPEVLDLDLSAGEMSFQTFCESKRPESDWDKYLLIAWWLKKNLDIAEITSAHIYTCFQYMHWQVPRDIPQPLRDMKSKKSWFNKCDERGAYALNHIGENVVSKMGS